MGGSGSVSTKKIKLKEWNHVAAQIKDRAHVYYINGEPAGNFPAKNPPPGKADTADALVGKTHERTRRHRHGARCNRRPSERQAGNHMGYVESDTIKD